MKWRVLLLAVSVSSVAALPRREQEGFRPVQGARGPSLVPGPRITRTASYGGGGGGNHNVDTYSTGTVSTGGGDSYDTQQPRNPDKTIYVRMPVDDSNSITTYPPKSAGPPQKHYRIVIIRNPTPPAVQPILPPKTEQKTVIYVLHQKPKVQQQVIETPVVKHAPQVLFVGYDEELSSDDLQKLAQGDHSGFTVTSQQNPEEIDSPEPPIYN